MDKEIEKLILKKLQLDYLNLHAILTDVEKIISALVVDLDPRVNEIQEIQDQIKGCIYVNLDEYLNDFVYKGLKELGVKFWEKDGELHFKYPEGLEGDGRKDLYKLIKDYEQILKAKVENESRRFYREL